MTKLFLYVMLFTSSGIEQTRYPMPNWDTCNKAAATVQYRSPQTSDENESAMVAFCAGPQGRTENDGTWHAE